MHEIWLQQYYILNKVVCFSFKFQSAAMLPSEDQARDKMRSSKIRYVTLDCLNCKINQSENFRKR